MKRFGKNRIRNTRWDITDKMFVSLALTGAVVEFSQVGANFIDGLITSNLLGSEAMAAIGIVGPVYSLIGIISGLIAVGMQTRCTQEIGRGNKTNMNRYFSVAALAGVIFSVITMLLLELLAKPFVFLLGARGNAAELADMAADYIRGLGLGVPAIIMTAVLAPAIQLDSGRKTIQTGAILSSVADVVLDYAAVRLHTGVLGIAVATAISYYVNLLYQCTHFLKKDRMLRFVRPGVSVREFLRMLTDGGEKAVKRAANMIRPIILNTIIISYGGTMAMSALSIHNNFSGFVEIFLSGIAEAVVLLTGLYFGERNEEGIREVTACSYRSIALTSGLICALLLGLARPISGLYVSEEGELKEMVIFAIRMLAIENPLIALISSRIKYLQAIQKKWNMNLLIFSARLIFILVSALLLGRLFGAYGILACFAFSDLLSLLVVMAFYQIKCRRLRLRLDDILALPPKFSPHPGDVISLDVRNMEEMSLTAEQISMFCRGHKFSKKICNYVSLVFEELTSNIITHGFPMNKASEPIVDVRLVAEGKRLILRLQDNCPRFDITKEIVRINSEEADVEQNIGIRITSRIAKNISYTSTFETNNIIIEYEDEA